MREREQSMTGHLTELRYRLVWVALFFVAALLGSFYFSIDIFRVIRDSVFMGKSIFARSPGDPLKVYMQISFLLAFLLTLPVLMYQLWQFVRPGLHRDEQQAAFIYIPLGIMLFLCGLGFGVFGVFPCLIRFLNDLNTKMGLTQMYGIYDAFSFFLSIVVPLALLFELPVIVLFLAKIGIVTPEKLQNGRRFAYLALVILSAVIAPPDLISNILIAIPLVLLYEVSIVLARWMTKRMKKSKE